MNKDIEEINDDENKDQKIEMELDCLLFLHMFVEWELNRSSEWRDLL